MTAGMQRCIDSTGGTEAGAARPANVVHVQCDPQGLALQQPAVQIIRARLASQGPELRDALHALLELVLGGSDGLACGGPSLEDPGEYVVVLGCRTVEVCLFAFPPARVFVRVALTCCRDDITERRAERHGGKDCACPEAVRGPCRPPARLAPGVRRQGRRGVQHES
jgi:hypothetical protein